MKRLLNNAGSFRNSKVWIGREGCPLPRYVPRLINSLEDKISRLELKPEVNRIISGTSTVSSRLFILSLMETEGLED